MNSLKSLQNLAFDNRFIQQLPADPETKNYCRTVLNASYSYVSPTKTDKPVLVSYSKEVADLMGLAASECSTELFTQVVTGNTLLEGMQPYACCYGGHQFGNWAGQLGDGRAINLGELKTDQAIHYTLQLKGAGLTPYSRRADGLAVLRSSVREYLCSEAMHHLGVPTTRALSLALTGDKVIRDMFYDGRPKAELGAVVCRVAPSFTRFGSFQIYTAQGDLSLLKQFVDVTLRNDFPHLGAPSKATYLRWFSEVCEKTALMVIHWQRVGFVHGVMNTDNMSILGLTIDYGPYGWLEDYNPHWTPNTTDASERRYRFGHQPQMAYWNLVQLANAIYPLIEDVTLLQTALTHYSDTFDRGWNQMMADKLGLAVYTAEMDEALIKELLEVLQLVETDMTIFYRKLALLKFDALDIEQVSNKDLLAPLSEAYYQIEKLTPAFEQRIGDWLRLYFKRIQQEKLTDKQRGLRMNAVNPKYIFRNYLAQLAIDKAEAGDFSMIDELLALFRYPYSEQEDKESYAEKRPEWARTRAGCSMLSCSS
ncbi:MAG: YdiU family protein [Methylococcales bacterium]|nr:YdiU family protein [Methylococcales bacterium]